MRLSIAPAHKRKNRDVVSRLGMRVWRRFLIPYRNCPLIGFSLTENLDESCEAPSIRFSHYVHKHLLTEAVHLSQKTVQGLAKLQAFASHLPGLAISTL